MFDLLWRSIAIGIGATILMDIWSIALGKGAIPNWGPPGRWLWHLFAKGTVFHDDIGKAAPYKHEVALGWAFHYAVGIIYGIMLVILTGPYWLVAPTFLPAWIWGIVTIAAGWFLLQPGLGIGWAASKTPNPNKVRFLGLVAHSVFGFGLYATALLIR